jgi:hypothetical protein
MASVMAGPSWHRRLNKGISPAFAALGMKQIKEEEQPCPSKVHVIS